MAVPAISRRERHNAEMRAQRDADAARRSGADLDFVPVDWDAGIVVSPVKDAERIELGRPSIRVQGLCVTFAAVCKDFVDGDSLSRFRLLDKFAIVVAPPGRDIAAKATPFVTGATTGPRRHVVDPHLENVPQFSVLDGDRTGADVHAEAFASTAPEDGRVEGAGASSVHGLSVLSPEEHLLRRRVTPDHQFGIVGGVLRERFNFNAVPGTNLENRPQRTTE